MEGSVTNTQRPFHETIVDAIRALSSGEAPNAEVLHWFEFIMKTKIPDNHDEILKSLSRLDSDMGITLPAVTYVEALYELQYERKELLLDYRRVLESVQQQKDAAILAKYEAQKGNPGPLGDVELTSAEEAMFTPEFMDESIARAMAAVSEHEKERLEERSET